MSINYQEKLRGYIMGTYTLSLILMGSLACVFSAANGNLCGENQFQCDNNNCIQSIWKCDNEDDCGDNSDETVCGQLACSSAEFECVDSGAGNGGSTCIPARWRCDGDSDCPDATLRFTPWPGHFPGK
ncbi:low-density lipoprotein receptor-related protein 8-like [Strongylocentrotus purpuratus]|uniref:Uncharacterized protein n=1 Tax=Strongylocentrotus purpuratus TaxID=7668 RepID=A0A7M7T451_STRPU|nr:low-density lipoprotein receptor-related protein 8-like [Strongylocentrotus purpuratus]